MLLKNYSQKRISYSLYIFSLLLNLVFFIIFKNFFKDEIIITDPRFEKVAYNLIHNGTSEINWGDGKIMLNPFEIQKGVYNNWYPIVYSLWLTIPLMTNENYLIVRTFLQVILFSMIPVLVFSISLHIFKYHEHRKRIAIITSLMVCLYPIYANFTLQGSDTGMITFFNALSLYLLFQSINTRKLKYFIQLGISLSVLFLLRPIGLLPYFVLIFIELFQSYKNKINYKYLIIPLFMAFLSIMAWGMRNLILAGEFNITYTNVGYNLWLGNNEFTNQVLKKRLGDGSTLEDEVIPHFDKKWKFLKELNEYEKDRFFKSKGIEFITNNPLETVENSLLKFIGYWSPLRMREGHWSDSRIKTLVTIIFTGPILILGWISIIFFLIQREYKQRREKLYIIILVIAWMVPHLLFFSTTRFRIPTDFCLIILTMDVLTRIIFKYKKVTSFLNKEFVKTFLIY